MTDGPPKLSAVTHESPQVLVTGASGFLGGHVVTELTSAGYRVLANGRDAGRLAGLGVDTLAAPLAALPTAPLQGGSFTVSSVGTAVQQACEALNAKLLQVASCRSMSTAGKVIGYMSVLVLSMFSNCP